MALENGKSVYYEVDQGKPLQIRDDIGLMELYLRTGATLKQLLFGYWLIDGKRSETKEEYVQKRTDFYMNYCKEQNQEIDKEVLVELQKQWTFDYEMDQLHIPEKLGGVPHD